MTQLRWVSGDGQTYEFPDPSNNLKDNFDETVSRRVRLPGVDGGFDPLGKLPLNAEQGVVTFEITLRHDWAAIEYSESDTAVAMRKAKDAIRALRYQRMGRLYKDIGNSLERWAWGKFARIGVAESHDRNTHLWQPVGVTFEAWMPFWFATGTETGTVWGSFIWGEGTIWGGPITGQAASGEETEWTVTYNGTVPTPVRISIGAGAGGVTNPTLQRLIGGDVIDQVSYAGALVDGDELQIHSRARKVRLNNADAYNADFTYETPGWFMLYPGENTIRLLMDDAGDEATVYLRYYEVYL